eukprot:TRINITY_DN34860_c0_g2_i1.p1 TRINITY_DN34860_c0_g2~~TRINITY_DN34860_c0_g2_i1.p1  ORF type:complete len:412 (+),score=65.83 TRINITY_DN34860_c0_g2_i1:111-1238(+)
MEPVAAGEAAVAVSCPLRLRPTGRVPVSALIVGTGPLGCGWAGDVEDEVAHATIAKGVELGVRYVDSAPWYGGGLAEERVGAALVTDSSTAPPAGTVGGGDEGDKSVVMGSSERVKLSTKVGRYIVSEAESKAGVLESRVETGYDFNTQKYHSNVVVWDYRGPGIRESARQSAKRLRVGFIDCLRVHDAEDEERWTEATAPGGAVETLVAMRDAGEIGEVSLGFNSESHLLRTIRNFPQGTFDNIMVARTWNLLDTSAYELLTECQQRGIKVHMAAVFCAGLLWGRSLFMYSSTVPPEMAERAKRWNALAESFNVPLAAVALAFAYLPECVEKVAFGAASPEEVVANVSLCDISVPPEIWGRAKADGLLPAFLNI